MVHKTNCTFLEFGLNVYVSIKEADKCILN